jgi:hypothetical protein
MDQLFSLGHVPGATKGSQGISQDQLPEENHGVSDAFAADGRLDKTFAVKSSGALSIFTAGRAGACLADCSMNQIASHVLPQVAA